MPYKPKKPCAHPGCPALTHKRFCETHERAHWKQVNSMPRPSAAQRGYDDEWAKVRNAYIKEHPVCEECGRGKSAIVHHVESVRRSPHRRLDKTNLRAVCRSCHASKHGSRKAY